MSQPICPGSGLWNDLRLNPKTCLCEPRTPTPTPPPSPKKPSPKKEKSKNCTKRNPPVKANGYCPVEKPYLDDGCCYITNPKKTRKKWLSPKADTKSKSMSKSMSKSKPKTLTIKNTTPPEDIALSKILQSNIQEKKTRKQAIKSFSPLANDVIQSINPNTSKRSIMKNYFTPIIQSVKEEKIGNNPANDVRYEMFDDEIEKLLVNPTIRDKTGKELKYTSQKAVNILINNLDKKVDCSKIIAPIQWQSNCWFNSGFMINFVSDKGRKFNRYLREAMIKGTIVKRHNPFIPLAKSEVVQVKNGTKYIRKAIKPPKLRKIFFVFNLCIEASLSGNQMAYFLDTNFIIREIYNAIPKNKMDKDMAKTQQAGNPQAYYDIIHDYLLGSHESSIVRVEKWFPHDNSMITDWYFKRQYFLHNDGDHQWVTRGSVVVHEDFKMDASEPPDIIEMTIYNNKSRHIDVKKKSFTLDYKGKKVNYLLDSVLIRDVKQIHFCCLITCNGKEFGFDGESFHRMSAFNWKDKINKNSIWTFEGSNTKWNFRDGYQLLYYYRV